MKLSATPLLEGSNASSFTISELTPTRFVDLLDSHKALLFQSNEDSFDLDVEVFGEFLVSLKLEYYPYIGGAAPRTIIPVKASKDKDIVFTANESPPQEPIPFHHELAQVANPPEYVFFYCDIPPPQGGQTPIIDSTLVYRFVQDNCPQFLSKLKQHGVRYIRTLPPQDDPTSPLGRSYQNSWNVTSPQELEDKLSQIQDCSWKWHDDGCVTITSEPIPAVRLVTQHVQNQVYQWTFSNSIIAAFLGWKDSRNTPRDALRFGNGDEMPFDVLADIANFMEQNRILYTWKHGDILALNNRLVMHSRNPFTGRRRVLASIWGPPTEQVRLQQPPRGTAVGLRPESFYRPQCPADPLVFGFWKVPKDKCEQVCYNAIQAGYRRLDCACDYGNEVEVGKGIARAIREGLVSRQDLFITSKLWNTFHQHVDKGLQKTLQDLQLDYLDEYLIHFPISMEYVPIQDKYPPEWTNLNGEMVLIPNDICATWSAMEQEVENGRVATIGVCNFSIQLLRQLMSTCRIRPVTLQVELHPHNAQSHLVRFAREVGMTVTAFSVLGASSYLELDMATSDDVLLQDKTVVAIAKANNKSPAQILIRWALQRNTLPLCKTSTVERMKENRSVFDFYLTGSEMKALNGLNKNCRYNDPGVFCEAGMGTFCPIYE